MKEDPAPELEKAARSAPDGIVRQYLAFLKQNKKYWMIPILIMLAVLGTLIILGGTAAAPFTYTLF